MTHPSKRKGDRAELEVQGLLRDHLGVPARRALGAGRKDDMGDIQNVPNTTIQCANYADIGRAIREKLPETVMQQRRAGSLFGALFCRRRGGEYVVIMTVDQWACLWREAQPVVPPCLPGSPVYLVWEVDYEDQNVLSVWTTRESAEQELERVKARGYSYGYEVAEVIPDQPAPP